MKKIDNFINQYSVSKTLRFQLLPVGKTEEYFNDKLMMEADEKRSADYAEVKKYLDRYYRCFIDKALSKVNLEGLHDYCCMYYDPARDTKSEENMKKAEDNLRKQIAAAFKKEKGYGDLFKKEIIRNVLPEFLEDYEEQQVVSQFNNFTTYFTGFFNNRENVFTSEEKSTGVAYRCINDNLPKFIDNIKTYSIIKDHISKQLSEIDFRMKSLYSELSDIENIEDIFTIDFYSRFLAQNSIEIYNKIIGGYSDGDGNKFQGINETVNLYNQKNKSRLPLLKPLYKQILSENTSISFIPEMFKSDEELIYTINEMYNCGDTAVRNVVSRIQGLFSRFSEFDLDGIYIISGLPVTDLSNNAFGSWNVFSNAWNEKYDVEHMPKKATDAYYEKRKAIYNSFKSFTLGYMEDTVGITNRINEYYVTAVLGACMDISAKYKFAEELLTNGYKDTKKLYKNDNAIGLIKDFLDSIKSLERIIKPLNGTGKELNKDESFYGQFSPLYMNLRAVDRLYDKVRNYLTQKPYSKEKIKLNFDNPQLLGGWDKNKEPDYRCILLRNGGKYYLGIMDKSCNKSFKTLPYNLGEECYEKMKYKLLPDPSKMLPKVFFAKSNIGYFAPSKEIIKIREKESFKKGNTFNLGDCRKFIDFYKESINKHADWKEFGFEFTDTDKYENIGEFYKEVKDQGYKIEFENVSKAYVDGLVEGGSLYLFQIYNKDFSEYSKGTPNLHTMYFKMLFDEKNLVDTVFKLNGEAEMFYRKASITEDEKIIHKANSPIKNKNELNRKPESIFEYDLIKDRRYTKRSFMLHVPITMNFHESGSEYINDKVRTAIRECDDNYVIGIDRGERNLLYVCVINGAGKIVEQYSLNRIISEYKDEKHITDYHKLLDAREKERDQARQNWTAVANIKELKEGYLSQVIHKICELVEKYDAIIALEDLNSGFKNSRKKVEKQVYQKFEKQLIDKLDFMTDKKKCADQNGGLLKAYQLANNGSKNIGRGIQNGFIFYVPAWLTSKIDPVTGFVDLFSIRYTNIQDAKAFFSLFKKIEYNETEDLFEFTFNYEDFPRGASSFRKDWTVCTNSERIITFRNAEKNNEWDNKTILLTAEFKELFTKNGLIYTQNLKEQIVNQESREFYEHLMKLYKYTLQLRNSVTGNEDIDYLISPVKDKNGKFFDSRNYCGNESTILPENADANGAYNIARKALYMLELIKRSPATEYEKAKITITNREWLEVAQSYE